MRCGMSRIQRGGLSFHARRVEPRDQDVCTFDSGKNIVCVKPFVVVAQEYSLPSAGVCVASNVPEGLSGNQEWKLRT